MAGKQSGRNRTTARGDGAAGKPAAARPTQQAAATAPPAGGRAGGIVGPWLYGLGIVALLVSMTATGMLIAGRFGNLALPGCGPGGGCEAAANSVFGKVPGTEIPISFAGMAFFAAALLGWLLALRGPAPGFRWFARIGGAISVFYLGVIVTHLDKYLCVYCLTAHIANLVFLGAVEARGWRSDNTAAAAAAGSEARPAMGRGALQMTVAAVALAAVFAGLMVVDGQVQASIREKENLAATQEIAALGQEPDGGGSVALPVNQTESVDAGGGEAAAASTNYGPHNPFVGRYILGPQQAVARVVIFSDYQCPDCRRIEDEMFELLRQYPERVSFSAKHSPFNSDCNPGLDVKKHANACFAAYLAEAAGRLGGADAFYRMHQWLFANHGNTPDRAAVERGAAAAGVDADALLQLVLNAENNGIKALVQADAQEAQNLGIYYTPMIFVNGQQVKNFRAFNYAALERAVQAVLENNPPPATYAMDSPPPACEKIIADFHDGIDGDFGQHARPHPQGYARGRADAPIVVHLWGDMLQEQTRQVAVRLVEAMQRRGDMQLHYHHYVFNINCNPATPRIMPGHDNACPPAKALEAAGLVGGEAGFWAMFDWLSHNAREDITVQDLEAAAAELGLDVGKFTAAMHNPLVENIIAEDGKHYKDVIGIRGLPGVILNGRRITRWACEDCPGLFDQLLDASKELK